MARWASLVQERRRERPTLLIDGGDFYFGGDVRFPEMNDRFLFRSMQLLRYDAIGVGENEMRMGLAAFLSRVSPYRLPLTTSNVIDRATREGALPPEIVKDLDAGRTTGGRRARVRVGVFAVTLPAFVYDTAAVPPRYGAIDPRLAALEATVRLRGRGCALVIAISHLGWDQSLALAREVPGIDIVLSGHRPGRTMRVERIGGTAVVEPGDKESVFTELAVTFGADSIAVAALNRCPDALGSEGDRRLVELQERYAEEKRRLERGGRRGGRTGS